MCEVSAKKEASLVQEAVCAQMCSLLERLVKIGSTGRGPRLHVTGVGFSELHISSPLRAGYLFFVQGAHQGWASSVEMYPSLVPLDE